MLSPILRQTAFDALPGWAADDPSSAFEAFRRSAFRVREKPYKTGSLGIEAGAFAEAQAEARAHPALEPEAARAFFERHFVPHLVAPDDRPKGFVTGFYEPVVEASPVRTEKFAVPFLSRPDDLVDLDEGNRPHGLDPYLAFGRQAGRGIVEYFDRRAIESGALAGRGLEVAWVESKVDAFFIHVQGAARLNLTDGKTRRITYAAKSGQRFSGPGRTLVDLGELPLEQVTMQSIRQWFADHPDRIDEILWQNRSYIFWREAAVDDPTLGPVAAAKVPLTAGRSMAVDRLLHTFGTPFFIDAPTLTAFDARPFARLMIAQDTCSAIVGPARGDLFAGSGDAAGNIAGVVRADADFYAFVPRALAGGR
jgi:membrane-bound lytic murein transglycosylase A